MTLDEAIKHAEEVAKEQEELYLLCPIPSEMCDPNKDCVSLKNGKNKGCIKCAEEHEQLAEWLKDYKRLKEQQPCEDCVSRQTVLAGINDWWGITSTSGEPTLCDYIRELPPVTPTSKVGKWIFAKTIFDKYGCTAECPSCHKKWKTYDEIRWKKENKFCPNCGVEMESEE